jgi:hypothetical protein
MNQQEVQIKLNSSNSKTAQANVLTKVFAEPARFPTTQQYEVALTSVYVFNSVFNITAALGNNTFAVSYNGTQYNATIPDGSYGLDTLNGWFQNTFLTNLNLYTLDSNGAQVFYQYFQPNSVYYSCTYTATPLTLSSGGSNPKALSLSGNIPLLIINSPGLATVLGFIQATFPAITQTTTYQVNSTSIPQLNSQFEYNITCSLVNQDQFSHDIPSAIYDFSPEGTTSGQQIVKAPANLLWFPVVPGNYRQISCSLVDQAGSALKIDPQWSVNIRVRPKLAGR